MARNILFFAAGFLLWISPGSAQSRYVVDASGGPGSHFKDLPKAVAAVPSGSYLYVRAGDYKPFHVQGKALHIRGEGMGKTRIVLDENTCNVTVQHLRAGEVFTFEDLSIDPAFYWGTPFQSPPAPRAPYLVLRFGTFVLRNVEIAGLNKGFYQGNQWVGSINHGKGMVLVEWVYLHAEGLKVYCGAAQKKYDSPFSPLPAGLACSWSFLELRRGKIFGCTSLSPQNRIVIRSSGSPGLYLYGSVADVSGAWIEGGHGSFSTAGLNRNSRVPAGNGGPGILLDGKSHAFLDGGVVRGGVRGQWQIHPWAALHTGLGGPGIEVRKGCLVRSRGTRVEGGKVFFPYGPVWTGQGVYKVFPPPVKRPFLEWVRTASFPDRGKLVLHAPPGSSLLLLCSPRPSWIPLGPLSLFGTLCLDPVSFFSIGVVKVSSSGKWELPLAPPPGAGIVGPWFLQAVRPPEGNHTITSNLVELVFWL